MLIHYLKISLRSIWKDKGFSSINILGLSVAIACCFLLIFWIKHEVSYENCYPNADRIYRILEIEDRDNGKHHATWIRPGIAEQLVKEFPEIEAATFARPESLPFVEVGVETKDGILANQVVTNADYLRIFSFEYIEGSPQVVEDKKGAIMTEETAKKFFGNESAIGKTVRFGFQGDGITIDAVVKHPENTHINFDILTLSQDGGNYGNHYIMLKENVKLTPEFEKKIETFLSTIRDNKNTLKLQPIKDMHLHSPDELSSGSLNQMILFSIAALLILVIAVVSYVNSSIARALNRLKEVGVRKVTGGKRRQLVERFLFEYFIVSLLAVLVAMAIVQLLFPYFSEVMGNKLQLDFDFSTIVIAFVVCIIITLLSGGYSAFYLSSFNPILAFRGGSATGSKEQLRKVLIGVQFFLSIAIFICTIFIYKQINMMMNADTGVKKDDIFVLRTDLWYDAQNFFDVIKKENPNIIDATITNSAPYNAPWSYGGVSWEGCSEDVTKMAFTQLFCDHNYANTFGLEIVQGEFIPPGLTWWQHADEKSFDLVINESFRELMGEENPIGITIKYGWGFTGKIIGVVKDFNFKPLKEKISPLILSFNPESCTVVYIKTTGKDRLATTDYIVKKYDEMKPEWKKQPAVYNWVEEDFNKMYEVELRTAKILSVFTIISFVLSLLGIFSMVAFMIEKRTKELAIRKINGAKIVDIMALFITDIAKVAVIASVIAIPICYVIVSQWLSSYVYRTPISWWIFIAIPLAIISITSALIGVQVFLTARKNPVNALRNE